MRSDIALSAIAHVAVVAGALVLFANPRPFDSMPPPAIAVEIVKPEDVPETPKPDPPKKELAFGDDAKAAPEPAAEQQAAPPQQPPMPSPAAPLMFDATGMASLFGHKKQEPSFDRPADSAANLSAAEIARLKAHLRRCWNPPASLGPADPVKAVVRIYFARDGALAAPPTLVSASASAAGPALVDTAMRAIRQCQPFAFLPADRYKEWKTLDVNFSPREMAGG